MYVTGVGPAKEPDGSHGRRRENAQEARQRTGFSSRHVILDLTLEAMNRIGYRPLAVPRQPQPVLFLYDDRGGLAYEEAARRYEQARPATLTPEPRAPEETLAPPESPPIPARVSFDGMLDGNRH